MVGGFHGKITAFRETFKISCLMVKTPYERWFRILFNGPVIPFGAIVEYHNISAKYLSRLHQFGSKVLPGIFLGYALYAVGIWKGDIMLADIGELEEMDASEIQARRPNAKEVLTPMKGDNFIFPVKRSTSETIHLTQELSITGRQEVVSRKIRRTLFSNPR